MFYTKYRPKKFAELLGAEHIVSSITSSLHNKTPAHAYFFSGSRGTGKTSTARLLAQALNCLSPVVLEKGNISVYEPCGKCESCKAIQENSHVDVIEIDAASNRGIDNIRGLKETVNLAPTLGKNKIYIIDEVHMLTTEASNALLKTLEEPPSHAFFVLCTTNPEKVLDTIKSRCQQFFFKKPNIEILSKKLKRIMDEEKSSLDDNVIEKIALAARGAFRDAETILEQYLSGNTQLSDFSSDDDTAFGNLLSHLTSNRAVAAISDIHAVYKSGKNLELFTEKFIEYLRTILLIQLGVNVQDPMEALDLSKTNKSTEQDVYYIKNLISIFTKASMSFRTTVVPTLPLELAVVESMELKTSIQSENLPSSSNPTSDSSQSSKSGGNKDSANGQNKADIKHAKNHLDSRFRENDREPVGNNRELVENDSGEASKSLAFPYKKLIEAVKPMNHSIHLLLHSCRVKNFDGKYLDLEGDYSFHVERIMSTKIKQIIQEQAESLVQSIVVIRCYLSDKKPDALKLTDINIAVPDQGEKQKVEDVFEKVFGDSLET